MPITTFSYHQFDHDVNSAKKAAQTGLVIITERGQPMHVLLTFEAYQQMARVNTRIADLLAGPDTARVEIDFLPMHDPARAADFF